MKSLLLTVVCLLIFSYESTGNALQGEAEPSLCSNPVVDAAMNIMDEVFFFQGENFWIRGKHGHMLTGPHLTVSRWPGAPPNMDAAIKMNALDNATVFFKGSLIWAYNDENTLLRNYPKRISDVLPGIPNDISGTATYYWDDRLKDYIFKDFDYWFPGCECHQVISEGWKLPPNTVITAGFKYFKYTYFFSGDVYWKYDPDTDDVAIGTPPYPRNVATYWFHCNDTSL